MRYEQTTGSSALGKCAVQETKEHAAVSQIRRAFQRLVLCKRPREKSHRACRARAAVRREVGQNRPFWASNHCDASHRPHEQDERIATGITDNSIAKKLVVRIRKGHEVRVVNKAVAGEVGRAEGRHARVIADQ